MSVNDVATTTPLALRFHPTFAWCRPWRRSHHVLLQYVLRPAIGVALDAVSVARAEGVICRWVTMGSIQSALLGFGTFKALQRCGLGRGFTVAENVIIQTTSVAVAMIPLTAGLVSVIPALGMLTVDDRPPEGPLILSTQNLMLWTFAVAFFGAFVAVPLRTQTILREKLPFPSGAATAKVIQLMHQTESRPIYSRVDDLDASGSSEELLIDKKEEDDVMSGAHCRIVIAQEGGDHEISPTSSNGISVSAEWTASLLVLLSTFALAFLYKIVGEMVTVDGDEVLTSFPIWSWLGWSTPSKWGWVLYPSPGYIGQGMIMGPRTCLSMLGGALTGFALLGPVARHRGWAPGPIDNMENGAKGLDRLRSHPTDHVP